MATHWTYDATLFASTTAGYYAGATIGERYQIRLWIQDVNTARQLFQDEEIDWQLTQEANAYVAAATLCDILVARAGNIKSKKISEFSITYDAEFYQALAGQLRARGAGHQVPYVGGTSITEKIAQQVDTDWVAPSIGRGVMDNPHALKPTMSPSNPLTDT